MAFYSGFFEALLYGKFVEGGQEEVALAETEWDIEGLKAFSRWTYTGFIETFVPSERLWILGDKLCSTVFKNEVMHVMFSQCNETHVLPDAVEYVFNNTTEKSRLWRYIKNVVLAEPPFSTVM